MTLEGTPGIKVPPYLQKAIAARLDATLDQPYYRFPYACDRTRLPEGSFEFTFAGNVRISVPIHSLVADVPDYGCRLLVQARPRDDSCILGAAMLRGAFVVFDRQNLRIGIAQAASDTKDKPRAYHIIPAGRRKLPLAVVHPMPPDYLSLR